MLWCRDWVASRHEASRLLADAYNDAIEEVYAFRRQHLIFAGAYIARQQPKSSSNPIGTGTGGTPFMVYLKDHAEQTLRTGYETTVQHKKAKPSAYFYEAAAICQPVTEGQR